MQELNSTYVFLFFLIFEVDMKSIVFSLIDIMFVLIILIYLSSK